MNEFASYAPALWALASAVFGLVLAIAAFAPGQRGVVSAALLLGALLLVLSAAFHLVSWLSEPVSAVPLAALAALMIAIGIGLGIKLATMIGSERARRAQAYRDMLAPEQREQRLRGLLKREHKRLASVNEMHRYFEVATRNAQITVFYQDADLRYQWLVNPRLSLTPENVIGLTDEECLPESIRPVVIGHKRRAISTNTTQSFEVELVHEGERAWFKVDVVPIGGQPSGEASGIVCTATDITRAKRLDMMRTDLSRRLAETLQRFSLALRSDKIMVFSQDLSLRYTWANSDETQIGSIIGRTDEEVIPEKDRAAIVDVKRTVIDTRRPASVEVGVGEGEQRRWYDLHVEPNLQADGSVSGITCASIDVTDRKRNEEHMRLVMRELTHRTKNLLAVVIAIARQTSTQATSVDTFLPALIGRLHALSAAQDLIVADDWAGVGIYDLVTVLIGQYATANSSRVVVEGPDVLLSPEASQNLGLAVHELASNAQRYGALANGTGTVTVRWSETFDDSGRPTLALEWVEKGGPPVSEPTTRGFGMMVIERNLTRALGAEVDLRFDSEGFSARMSIPTGGVIPFQSPDRMSLARVG